MRKPFTVPLAITIAFGVLALAGCGDDADSGADESRGQARQAEPETASSEADAAVLWPAPAGPPRQDGCSRIEA